MALKTAVPKRIPSSQSQKKSPKKLTLLDLIDIDQLVNEHAEVVSTTTVDPVENIPGARKKVFNRDKENSKGIQNTEDNDDETQSEKEWNLKEEITFEKICLTLLSEQNWNGLAIESKRHL